MKTDFKAMVGKRLVILAFAGVVLCWGCRQNGVSPDEANNPPAQVKGENFSFYTSGAMYEEAREQRSDNYSEPFEITYVWRSEEDGTDYLNVEVKHKKACDDRFKVIWDGRVAESYPPQLYLMIRLDAEDCGNLNAFATDILSLDLYKVTGDSSLAEEAIFRVSNGSSDQDIDHDEPVSDSR